MPRYEFEDTETNETFVEYMTFEQRDVFLKNNPNVRQCLSTPGFVSGVNYNKKMDSGWKDHLSRIAEANPNSALANEVGGRKSSKVKSANVAKKLGLGKTGKYNMPL